MKAAAIKRYGLPPQLEWVEKPLAAPQGNALRVRVMRSSINDWDAGMVTGKPFFMRALYGLVKPNRITPGCDVAGVVDAVGPDVRHFAKGDNVYGDLHGDGFGAFATHVCAPESAFRRVPPNLTWDQAGALPHALTLAWQGLNRYRKPKDGQHVLINGAGGGVGPLVLQLVRDRAAQVTGVDHGDKSEQLLSIGFDRALDYRVTDFTRTGEKYDWIFDVKSTRGPSACARALNPGGTYVTVGGSMWRIAQIVLSRRWFARRHDKHLHLLTLNANEGLNELYDALADGRIRPALEGPYPLSDLQSVLERFIEARHFGKIVIAPNASHKPGPTARSSSILPPARIRRGA